MSLADRIAKIEAKLLAGAPLAPQPVVPAILITMPGRDNEEDRPHRVEHAGKTWTQSDGESTSKLLHRAHLDILALPQAERGLPDEPFPVLLLVAEPDEADKEPHDE